MNWNLLWNILSVVCGALGVYYAPWYPMAAIGLAFVSGIIVALSARLDFTIVREDVTGPSSARPHTPARRAPSTSPSTHPSEP